MIIVDISFLSQILVCGIIPGKIPNIIVIMITILITIIVIMITILITIIVIMITITLFF